MWMTILCQPLRWYQCWRG